MAKANKKNLGKKNTDRNCKVNKNCNISDVTDSVEFANEPFNDTKKEKCSQDKKTDNRCR